MAGGNHPKGSSNKPTSSSSSHRKSRWESSANAPAGQKAPVTGDSKQPQPPPPTKSKPSPNVKLNPSPKPNSNPSPSQRNHPPNPSPRPGPGPFPDNLGPPPPPAYGFHMLDRRSILLADGSVRSYFALPPDYQDFTPPSRHHLDHPGRFMPHGLELGLGFERQFPPGGPIRDDPQRHHSQDYWNSLGGIENAHKRKFGDEGEMDGRREEREGKDEFARQRQQLLQYGNVSSNPNGYSLMGAGPSSPYGRNVGELGRGDEMRAGKYMRLDGEYGNLQGRHNVGTNKHNEVNQVALKKAFLHYMKLITENATQMKNYLADGKQGPLPCLACGRSSNDFPDMHALIMHTHNSDSSRSEQIQDHLGLHKALCILMGWNYSIPPDYSRAYRVLSADEAAANQDDLIMWPPVVIIQNTITGKGRDGRLEGVGNKAMDNKLRDLGFTSGKSKAMYGREGHMGSTMVKFTGDQSGLKEAVRLAEYFEKDNHGRRAWAAVHSLLASGKDEENNPNLVKLDKKTGEKERIFYGYLGTVFDLDKVDFETRKKVVIESRREYKPNQ